MADVYYESRTSRRRNTESTSSVGILKMYEIDDFLKTREKIVKNQAKKKEHSKNRNKSNIAKWIEKGRRAKVIVSVRVYKVITEMRCNCLLAERARLQRQG